MNYRTSDSSECFVIFWSFPGIKQIHLLPLQHQILQTAEEGGRDWLHQAWASHPGEEQEPRQSLPPQDQPQHVVLQSWDDHELSRRGQHHSRHVQGQRQVKYLLLAGDQYNVTHFRSSQSLKTPLLDQTNTPAQKKNTSKLGRTPLNVKKFIGSAFKWVGLLISRDHNVMFRYFQERWEIQELQDDGRTGQDHQQRSEQPDHSNESQGES